MIPPILMLCVKDVEERGIDEVGIYRVPGNECHANEILDIFMKVSINSRYANYNCWLTYYENYIIY